ncbi:hypothetical protein Q0F98_02640 [Paenibacillus amylolyticus]|nr:hypothetical protein Q0F98_02640 [Paenibacillus amylolyticus]
MQLDEQMKCWNHAAVKVLDIRRIVMEAGAQLSSYTLPANGFIYTIRGSAVLQLDGQTYKAERFYMLHGAKGSSLDIQTNEDFEYILLYYRAFLAFPSYRKKWLLAQPEVACSLCNMDLHLAVRWGCYVTLMSLRVHGFNLGVWICFIQKVYFTNSFMK